MNRYSITKQQLENSPVRVIGIIAYPGAEIIDIVGPMEVFTFANDGLRSEGLITEPVYQVKILSKDDQPITTLSGLQIVPMDCYENFDGPLDLHRSPYGGEICPRRLVFLNSLGRFYTNLLLLNRSDTT